MKLKPGDRVLWRKAVYLLEDSLLPITFTFRGEVVKRHKNSALVRTFKPSGEPFDRWLLSKDLERDHRDR